MKMTPVLVKLGVFLVVTLTCSVLVANTLYRPFSGSTTTYRAEFVDALGLKKGSDVRIAGIRVGRVNTVELTGHHATATFEVSDDQRIPANVEAHVRYADLLGARYIALKPTADSRGTLAEDAVIPLARTTPAVDLTDLFNGFKPVFTTLEPAEINKLARELVAVFQGEGGTVESLLGHVVTLTNNVGDQDKLIGEVLTGLNQVTDFALQNEPNFQRLIESLSALASGMAKSRGQIGKAIDASGELARSLNGMVTDVGPALERNLTSLNRLTGVMVDNSDEFTRTLKATPTLFKHLNRASEYGAWLNVYLCKMLIETGLPLNVDLGAGPHSEVCRP